jgi:hypothetical protein
MPRTHVPITPDELRLAFTGLYLRSMNDKPRNIEAEFDDDESDELDELPEGDLDEEASAKDDSLRRRVMLLMMWLMQDEAQPLVNGNTPLGVPILHEAVFEAAASVPLPTHGLPKPGAFFRELEARVKAHSFLSGRP